MANQSLSNVKDLMKNKSTRVVVILTFGVVLAALIFANMSISNQQNRPKELQPTVSTPTTVPAMTVTPGTSDNPLHNDKVREQNRDNASQAQRTGDSTVPRLTSVNGDKEKDPFDLLPKKPNGNGNPTDPIVPTPTPTVRAVPQAAVTPPPLSAPLSVPKTPERLAAERDSSAAMAAAIAGALNSWSLGPQKIEIDYAGTKMTAQQTGQTVATTSGAPNPSLPVSTAAATTTMIDATKKVAIKAGTILHAVMLTSVNSDEPGPILAQITTGPYAGGRLIGKFELAKEAEKIVVTFSTLTMQNADKSFQISGYAVDPTTARTALASDVDHHYLERYGLFSAATFLKGYSQALTQSGSTQTISAGAAGVSATTTYPTLTTKQIALTALGSVGGEVSQPLKDGLKRPPTVTLNTGTEIGILVMQDTSF